KFLDDLAVASHRTIEPLQVAVDDEDEVVEIFAGGHADGTHGLGFVHFAVATEYPYLPVAGVCNAPGMQILEKPRLVDGHERTQPHGNGRELPEIGHEVGVRIGRNPLAIDLL